MEHSLRTPNVIFGGLALDYLEIPMVYWLATRLHPLCTNVWVAHADLWFVSACCYR